MKLAEVTWLDVETYLKRSQVLILPIGSTEQHGPTGLIGTDHQSASEIAYAVGHRAQVLVAPPLCYGMALHHMGFPGSASLLPSTFIRVLVEVLGSFVQHGFRQIMVINGHGGNIAPITSAFSDLKSNQDTTHLRLINWWHLPEVQAYEKRHFGDANGFHATCGEVSVTQYLYPDAFSKIQTDFAYFATPRDHHWPMSPQEFKKTFPDGRMGSDPRMASPEHGHRIFDLAVESICKTLENETRRRLSAAHS